MADDSKRQEQRPDRALKGPIDQTVIEKQLPVHQLKEFHEQEIRLLEKLNILVALRPEYSQFLLRDSSVKNKKLVKLLDYLTALSKQLILASQGTGNHQALRPSKFTQQVNAIYTVIVGTPDEESVLFEGTFGKSVFEIARLLPDCNELMRKIATLDTPIYPLIFKADAQRAEDVADKLTQLGINNAKTISFREFLSNISILPPQHLARYPLLLDEIIKHTKGYPKEIKKLKAIKEKLIALAQEVNANQNSKAGFNKQSKSQQVATTPENIIKFLAYLLVTINHFDKDDYFDNLRQKTLETLLTYNIPNVVEDLQKLMDTEPRSEIAVDWEIWKSWLRNIRNLESSEDSITALRAKVIYKQSNVPCGINIFERGREKYFIYETVIKYAISLLKEAPDYYSIYLDNHQNNRKSIPPIENFQSALSYGGSFLLAKTKNKTLFILAGLRIQALVLRLERLLHLNAEQLDNLIYKNRAPFSKDIRGLIAKIACECFSFFGQPLPYDVQTGKFASIFNVLAAQFQRNQFVTLHKEAASQAAAAKEKTPILAIINILAITQQIMRIHTQVTCSNVDESNTLFSFFSKKLTPLDIWKKLSSLFLVADKAAQILMQAQSDAHIPPSLQSKNLSVNPDLLSELKQGILDLEVALQDLTKHQEISWLLPNLRALLADAEGKTNQSDIISVLPLPSYMRFFIDMTPGLITTELQRFIILRVYAYFYEYLLEISSRNTLFPIPSIKERFIDYMCSLLQALYLLPANARQLIMKSLEEPSIIGLLRLTLGDFTNPTVGFKKNDDIVIKLKMLHAAHSEVNADIAALNTELSALTNVVFGNTSHVRSMQSSHEFFLLLAELSEYNKRTDIKEPSTSTKEDGLTNTLNAIENFLNYIQTNNIEKKFGKR